MNHVVYFIGGPWDQHKVLMPEEPHSTYVVATLSDSMPVTPYAHQGHAPKVKKENYFIDKIGETSEAMIYMARHERVIDHGY